MKKKYIKVASYNTSTASKTGTGFDATPQSSWRETIQKIWKSGNNRHWILLILTILLFLASIISLLGWLPTLLKGQEDYHSNKTFILQDDSKGMTYYIGKGNKVSIFKDHSLILQNDTLEVGDSICHLLHERRCLNTVSSQKDYSLIKKETITKDRMIVASILNDAEIWASDKRKVLFARSGEHFIVNSDNEKKDTIQLTYNGESFYLKSSEAKLDTISAAEYTEIPFKLDYAIQDRDKSILAIRLNRITDNKSPQTDSLQNSNTISIYPLYGDKLLGKIDKIDSTYVFDATNEIGLSDSLTLRFVYGDIIPAYVVTAIPPNDIIHFRGKLQEGASLTLSYIVTGVLLVLFILSLTLLIMYYRGKKLKKSEQNKNIQYLKEQVDKLEEKLRDADLTEYLFPNDLNEYENWFAMFENSEGDKVLYANCLDSFSKWEKEKESTLLEPTKTDELYKKEIEVSIINYFKSKDLEGLEKKYIEAKANYLESLMDMQDASEKEGEGSGGIIIEDDEPKTIDDYLKIIEQQKEQLLIQEKELNRLREVEKNRDNEIRNAQRRAKQESDTQIDRARRDADNRVQTIETRANQEIKKANRRAETAEEEARNIRQEVTNQFEGKINALNSSLLKEQDEKQTLSQRLSQTQSALSSKETENGNLSRELENKKKALAGYSARIEDVQPAGTYAKQVEKLLQIGHRIEKTADSLLDKDIDDYLLTKYISRYQKALHSVDMDQFATDVLNIANVQFVYKQ